MFLKNGYQLNKTIFLALFVVFALLHLFIVLFNHYYFRTFAYYYGVYNFAFYDFAHIRSSPIPLLFDTSNATFSQDHFSLLFILAIPVFWLFNFVLGTYTLLIFQWVFIVYGAWATYKLIIHKSGSLLMATAAMLCYFLMYSRFSSYQSDCNLAIMGSALIPVFLYYFETKQIKFVMIVFAVLLITREDFSLWLCFLAVFLMIQKRKEKQQLKLAAWLFGFSLFFFIVLFSWIIPSLETETAKFALFNYSALGATPLKAMNFILQQPLAAIKLLFVNHLQNPDYDWNKMKYYLVFGLSGGLLLLLRPVYLICLIPIITKKMYNDDALRWTYETYYGIETASIIPALVFMSISDFHHLAIRKMLTILVVVFTLSTSYYCFSVSNYPPGFSKFQFFKSTFYIQDYPARSLHQLLLQIPSNAAVSASPRLLPHLAYRQKIYYFNEVYDAEYVCISLSGDTWPYSQEDYNETIHDMIKNKKFRATYAVGNIVLFRRQ